MRTKNFIVYQSSDASVRRNVGQQRMRAARVQSVGAVQTFDTNQPIYRYIVAMARNRVSGMAAHPLKVK
jgi:hypothetical protein